MELRPEVRDAGVAEQEQLDVVPLSELLEKIVEVPANPREGLVEGSDVDADAQRAITFQRAAPRAPQPGREFVA
jgi:hypothetical protein